MALLWLALSGVPAATLISQVTGNSDPASAIPSYLLSLGLPGIGLLALGAALVKGWRMASKGWRLVSPEGATAIREEGRADLIAERDRIVSAAAAERDRILSAAAADRDRLIGEKRDVERERDDALKVARDQLIPLLVQFTTVTQSLLPILQNLAAHGTTSRRRGGADT